MPADDFPAAFVIVYTLNNVSAGLLVTSTATLRIPQVIHLAFCLQLKNPRALENPSYKHLVNSYKAFKHSKLLPMFPSA